jgi:hypothetical protein
MLKSWISWSQSRDTAVQVIRNRDMVQKSHSYSESLCPTIIPGETSWLVILRTLLRYIWQIKSSFVIDLAFFEKLLDWWTSSHNATTITYLRFWWQSPPFDQFPMIFHNYSHYDPYNSCQTSAKTSANESANNQTQLCRFSHCFLILPIAFLGLWRPLNVPPQATQ